MPSRPLSADRAAVVRLQTKLDTEAIDITKKRTDRPSAVAALRYEETQREVLG